MGQPKVKDISKKVPPGVMSKSSYKKSHAFLKKLDTIPHVIKYKSVRDQNGNFNYAVYFKNIIQEDGIDPKKIIINPKNRKSVEVTVDKATYEITPNF